MDPHQYCQDKAAASGSSFYYSFRFLPERQRQAITAFYAFCREVDDVVDECSDAGIARRKLDWWRGEVDRMYAGHPEHPVSQALAEHAASIPRQSLLDIIDGMEMDLEHGRYNHFEDLKLYCHRVAGVVGEVSARLFGFHNPQTLEYANTLGLAFQLTNIIRDVGEDARRNRIYLPVDELQRFDVPARDILTGQHSEAFVRLMEFQYQRANQLYDQAMLLLPAEDRKAQKTGLVMAAIYRSLLDEIRDSNFEVLNARISLTPLRKLWLAWRAWMRG